jgi:hypothetical protein
MLPEATRNRKRVAASDEMATLVNSLPYSGANSLVVVPPVIIEDHHR